MHVLRIEHAVTEFEQWAAAFARFARKREEGGVLGVRILRPVDDAYYVALDLDFATIDRAESFERFLRTKVWSDSANSPALVGAPQTRTFAFQEIREGAAPAMS
jgi:hypothetical protein